MQFVARRKLTTSLVKITYLTTISIVVVISLAGAFAAGYWRGYSDGNGVMESAYNELSRKSAAMEQTLIQRGLASEIPAMQVTTSSPGSSL